MSNTDHQTSRRKVLKQTVGLAGVVVVASVTATRSAKADGGTMSPSSVGYVNKPSGTHQCSNCSLYIPGNPVTANGLCKAVAGSISPTAWCQIWSPMS